MAFKKIVVFFSLFFFLGLFLTPDAEAKESVFFVHQDHLGSSGMVSQAQGEITAQQNYYPYGSSRGLVAESPTERRYTGQISDQDQTDLYYYHARYYDTEAAIFTQADTGVTESNRYAYVGANPIKKIDPTGHQGDPVGEVWDWIQKRIRWVQEHPDEVDTLIEMGKGLFEQGRSLPSSTPIPLATETPFTTPIPTPGPLFRGYTAYGRNFVWLPLRFKLASGGSTTASFRPREMVNVLFAGASASGTATPVSPLPNSMITPVAAVTNTPDPITKDPWIYEYQLEDPDSGELIGTFWLEENQRRRRGFSLEPVSGAPHPSTDYLLYHGRFLLPDDKEPLRYDALDFNNPDPRLIELARRYGFGGLAEQIMKNPALSEFILKTFVGAYREKIWIEPE
jgi:RHS repeat-associated protein